MRKLLIVDPSLFSLLGHSYNYVHAIREAARSSFDEVVVYADRGFRDSEGLLPDARAELNRLRVDRLKRWANDFFHLFGRKGVSASNAAHSTVVPGVSGWMIGMAKWLRAKDLEWSLRSILSEHARAGDDVHVFIQHAHFSELVLTGRLRTSAQLHLVLRYSPELVNAGQMPEAGFRALLAKLDGMQSVHLYTDSERLSAEYAAIGVSRVRTLPVPILVPADAGSQSGRDEGAVRVSFLGSARVEKGFCDIPGLIPKLPREAGGKPLVTMVQVSSDNADPRVREATRELRDMKALRREGRLELLESPVPMRTYYEWVSRASIAAMPYSSRKYNSSTSGIFVEALYFDVPVICPAESWMADVIEDADARMSLRIGEVVRSIDDLPSAVEKIAASLPHYREAVREFAQFWRKTHNAEACVKMLLAAG